MHDFLLLPRHIRKYLKVVNNHWLWIGGSSDLSRKDQRGARLMQKVSAVYKVVAKAAPVFVRREIIIEIWPGGGMLQVQALNIYQNIEDNTLDHIGSIRYLDNDELDVIIEKLALGRR